MPDFKRPYFETKSDKKAFPVTLPEDILENELMLRKSKLKLKLKAMAVSNVTKRQ